MKIYLGCDHQGAKIKNDVIRYIKGDVNDANMDSIYRNDSNRYDAIIWVNTFLGNYRKWNVSKGLYLYGNFGSGIGMSIAANKVKGIRCARVVNEDDAFTCKNHNGANVIAFSANIPFNEIEKLIDAFLLTKYPNEERHLRRIDKVNKIEEGTFNA